MESYGPLAASYDALTGDVPYGEFADYYEKLLIQEGKSNLTLLDLCCGTGSLTYIMAQRGHELIGVDVYSDGQFVGKIKDVLDYPGNSVYVVKGEHEYMIPAVKAFILSTDMDANRMEVKLIEGMASDEN